MKREEELDLAKAPLKVELLILRPQMNYGELPWMSLDFVPFSNASYSGGILITEWFDGNSNDKNEKRDLKITVRFLTNEIRSDALDISIHERKCQSNGTTCSVNKIKSELEPQIGLAILKRAAILEKKQFSKNSKDYLSKKRTTLEKKK